MIVFPSQLLFFKKHTPFFKCAFQPPENNSFSVPTTIFQETHFFINKRDLLFIFVEPPELFVFGSRSKAKELPRRARQVPKSNPRKLSQSQETAKVLMVLWHISQLPNQKPLQLTSLITRCPNTSSRSSKMKIKTPFSHKCSNTPEAGVSSSKLLFCSQS